jgi:alpha-ketoglutarate-dependent taurine dioxygenase
MIDLSPRIGTEIQTDKQTLLSGKLSSEIRTLLEQRGVIVFREINLLDEEQVAFTRTLGTQRYVYPEPTYEMLQGWQRYPDNELPLV